MFKVFQDSTKLLIKTQPNMALLRGASSGLVAQIKRMIKANRSYDEIIKTVIETIESMKRDINENIETIAASSSRIISNFNSIMTTSNSTLVRVTLEKAAKQKKKFEVFCLKSHPPDEGIVMAENLAKKGVKTTLIPDAQVGCFLPQMNLVFIGADRLYETGFINKAGSLPLCLAANFYNIPVYLTVETTKLLKESERTIKRRFYPKEEVYAKKIKKLRVENMYYERVPYKVLSKIMCEQGVFETHEFIKWFLGE
jgi:translation initiation factor 2B subunit (eIF-2B alpha/beta/delta family)